MIKKINIHRFRLFNDVEFNLGKRITVISGQNATGKSTLLGLLGATAEIPKKAGQTVFGKQFKANFAEMFTASKDHDPTITKMMTLTLCESTDWNTPTETFDCRTGQWARPDGISIRYRIIPKRQTAIGTISAKKLEWPTLYLGLSRLYPIGESEDLKSEKFKSVLTSADKEEIGQLYNRILFQPEPVTDILGTNPSDAKRKNGIGANTPMYDHLCNSAGQDNLGQILLSVLSFKKLKAKMGDQWRGGLLLIDEFDATLHAASQEKLFNYLIDQCDEIGIQIALTTHSLYLLEHITTLVKNNSPSVNNDVELIYFTTANGSLEVKSNPDYDTIRYDLNMKLRPENREKIKIYCEDDEARVYAKILLEDYLERIHFADFSAGCDQLIALYKSDTYFQDVIIMLDGDARNKCDTLTHTDAKARVCFRVLPLDGMSPEKTLYKYIFEDAPTQNLIDCFDATQGQSVRSIHASFPLSTNPELKERERFKKWFVNFNNQQGALLNRIVKAWITDHQTEYGAFIESFKNSFNIIASRKRILSI